MKEEGYYIKWINEFPLKPLWDVADLKKANAQLLKVSMVERYNRDSQANAYIGTLEALIRLFIQEEQARLIKKGGTSDHLILDFCMAAFTKLDSNNPKDLLEVSHKCGIPPANIAKVRRRERRFNREEIAKLCFLFQCNPLLWDFSTSCVLKMPRRFGLIQDYNDHYVITDEDRQRSTSKHRDDCVVLTKDCNGHEYEVQHDAIGFYHTFLQSLNDNYEATLKTYFPKTWEEEYKQPTHADELATLQTEAEKELSDVSCQLRMNDVRGA